MTQEQKQFIIKALQTGIPAIAQEYIEALEEVTSIADMPQEELNKNCIENFNVLNQERFDTTVKVIKVSAPFMSREYLIAYSSAVDVCNAKFRVSIKAREEREKAESEKAQVEAEIASDKKKKSEQ